MKPLHRLRRHDRGGRVNRQGHAGRERGGLRSGRHRPQRAGGPAVGADRIIGVDLNPLREPLARCFGLTYFVNPKEVAGDLDPAPGGADRWRRRLQLRARGQRRSDAVQALECSPPRLGRIDHHRRGGARARRSAPGRFSWSRAASGAGSLLGGKARGRTDVPGSKIVDWWHMNGKIEIDSLITHKLPLERINEGVRPDARRHVDSHRGRVLMADAPETLFWSSAASAARRASTGTTRRPPAARCAFRSSCPRRRGARRCPRCTSWPASSTSSRSSR